MMVGEKDEEADLGSTCYTCAMDDWKYKAKVLEGGGKVAKITESRLILII